MNYKQSAVIGESWVRANRVIIDNSFNDVPTIRFQEEKVISDGTNTVRSQLGDVSANMTDPTAAFQVINPATGERTGMTATHGDIYALLHSLYLDLAEKRDNPQIAS